MLKNPNIVVYNKTYNDTCSQLEDKLLENNFLKSYSFINETLLRDYNRLFDEIFFSIKVSEVVDNYTIEYNYNSLCPKRLNKCAVEGGIMRASSFQRNLLRNEIYYDWKDSTK
jgi:hypothetical protein